MASSLGMASMSRPAGGERSVNQPMRGVGSARPRQHAERRQDIERPTQKMRQAAQRSCCGKSIERRPPRDRRHAQPFGEPWRALHHRFDAARQHQRVAQRGIALDVGLLGVDQQPARQRLALPARQVGRVAVGGDLQPRLVVAETAQPVALAQTAIRRGAGADADRWAGWSAPSRDRSARPSSRRAPPAGWRAPTATASGDGRSTRPRCRRARPRRDGPSASSERPLLWAMAASPGFSRAARSRAARAAACSPSTDRQPARLTWAAASLGRNLAARSSGSRASAKRPSFSRAWPRR